MDPLCNIIITTTDIHKYFTSDRFIQSQILLEDCTYYTDAYKLSTDVMVSFDFQHLLVRQLEDDIMLIATMVCYDTFKFIMFQ